MILKIKTRNKDFDLLQDMQKNLGVVFHPNTTVSSVETLIKEKANANTGTPKLQAKYDKAIIREKDLKEKLKKLQERKKQMAWKIHQIKYHPISL